MLSFREFYLLEGTKSKHRIPPTDVSKNTDTYVSREDGSASDEVFTTKEWRDKQGRLHRDDGPAMILTDDKWSLELDLDDIMREYPDIYHVEAWFTHGKLNRQDGPAKTTIKDGKILTQEWYKNGKRHRVDGPAHIYHSRGSGKFVIEEFYIEGVFKYKKQTSIVALGRKLIEYRNSENELHRDGDKPAYIMQPSSLNKVKEMSWFKHGKRHRLTGPAVIVKNYNRVNSSGLVVPDIIEYYIDGKRLLPNEFKQLTKQYSEEDLDILSDLMS